MQPPERKSLREISAGIIVYRRTEEGVKFLLLYHGHSYWNFAKGKIESEEKSLEAALRETEEETGISARDLRLDQTFQAHERFVFRRGTNQIYKTVIFYLAEARTEKIVISTREHSGYGWFSMSEAKRIIGKYRDSQRVLKLAHDFLQRGSARIDGRINADRKHEHAVRPRQSQPILQQSSRQAQQHGQNIHPAKEGVPHHGVQRKSVRPHAPHPAWQGGNVRRYRGGARPPWRGPRGGERTQQKP